jgi:ribosomal protein S18 acetylase RimI-like enzyme
LPEEPIIRAPVPEEAAQVASLLYLTSPGGFALFGGSPKGGMRVIEDAFGRSGTDNSREVVTVAELDGRLAGAMAAFPVSEAEERRRRFLRTAIRHRAPWHWLHIWRLARHGSRHAPKPPPDAFYVDALATGDAFRRRGVAMALLREAERLAREGGFPALALDTVAENQGARALYTRFGFEIGEERRARPPIPALVGYVKRLA